MSSGCYLLIGATVQLSTSSARQGFCSASSFCRKPRDGDAIEIYMERKSTLGLQRKARTPHPLSPHHWDVEVLHYLPSFSGHCTQWLCIYCVLLKTWSTAQFAFCFNVNRCYEICCYSINLILPWPSKSAWKGSKMQPIRVCCITVIQEQYLSFL